MKPRSINIFLLDGDPNGIRVLPHPPERCPMEVELSVFPAVPVPCAVEFGRTWQPKAYPPFRIYDQVPDRGFVLRHRIMRTV
jgi:hypothetical protein